MMCLALRLRLLKVRLGKRSWHTVVITVLLVQGCLLPRPQSSCMQGDKLSLIPRPQSSWDKLSLIPRPQSSCMQRDKLCLFPRPSSQPPHVTFVLALLPRAAITLLLPRAACMSLVAELPPRTVPRPQHMIALLPRLVHSVR